LSDTSGYGKDCHIDPASLPSEFTMATMNVSLPDPMKVWVERQSAAGAYANSSDYVRDLIRRDQARAEAIARMQALVDEGLASGEGTRTMAQIKAEARRRSET
jgi:antitoxin ParD1/3/4